MSHREIKGKDLAYSNPTLATLEKYLVDNLPYSLSNTILHRFCGNDANTALSHRNFDRKLPISKF